MNSLSNLFFVSNRVAQVRLKFHWTYLLVALTFACSHNPNKAEKIESKMVNPDSVIHDENIGVNKDGDMIWQKKVSMNEELRRLQFEVYELEDRVYGSRKYGSTGLFGALKTCETHLAARENGGNGTLMWTEPLDRITDKEEVFNVGLDEKDRLVGVSEEFLKDRIGRFVEYKRILMKKQDEFDDKLSVCEGEMKSRSQNKKAPNEATNQ